MNKCKPFECVLFKKLYEVSWDQFPADEIVVRCKHRVGKGTDCDLE